MNPITLDPTWLLEDIDLNLNETYNGNTMREAFLKTVQHINKKLANVPDHPSSIQQARIISLDTGSRQTLQISSSRFCTTHV